MFHQLVRLERMIRRPGCERAERLQGLFGKLSGEKIEELSALLAKILRKKNCNKFFFFGRPFRKGSSMMI